MARLHSQYTCQQCGYKQARYFGRCPECGEWGTAVETTLEEKTSKKGGFGKAKTLKPVSLTSVSSKSTSRTKTKMGELDRVLGGGVVAGQVILLAGEPGIGKSTILLQLSEKLGKVLYVSGEESLGQVAIRAKRLGVKKATINFLEETNIDNIISTLEEQSSGELNAVIIDSIQTMFTSDLSGMAGSVGQVREVSYRLVRFAKSKNIPIFIVGHVTKEGTVAGPSVLMHIVDTVLWFEGDKSLTLRLLRAVKNRFGPTDEVGIFSMQDKGLVGESNPEKLFISSGRKSAPGSAITSVMQGTRPMLVEVQGLVVPTKMAYPRRIAQGIDSKRFELLLAVLSKRAGIPLYDFDCYLNVSGGISIRETASDLAICLSIASAYFDKALPPKSLVIGEVGLLGDVREVVAQEKRVKEAKRLGYKNIISSDSVKSIGASIKKYIK
jgi:DNA repair protein RadA/Sms